MTNNRTNIVRCPACSQLAEVACSPETAACGACGNIMLTEASPETTMRRYALPGSLEHGRAMIDAVVQEQLETFQNRGADEDLQWRFVETLRSQLEQAINGLAGSSSGADQAKLSLLFVADHRSLRWSIDGDLGEARYRS